jgi:hypothetical protein
MGAPRVISREYKAILRAERFRGDQKALLRAAGDFWQEFRQAIGTVAVDTDGKLNEIGAPRFVRFLDTADHMLNQQGYLFRERRGEKAGEREVTLKFRHADRYVAQDRGVEARGGSDKFEEDIKPVFETLYSFSSTVKVAARKKLNRMEDPGRLFPGLGKRLARYRKRERLEIVGGFTAREVVVTGGRFRISRSPRREAECALIVWHDADGEDRMPAVVEFSFRWGNGKGKYPGEASQRAMDAFRMLQEERLSGWVDGAAGTKTAFVYALGRARARRGPRG